MRTADADGDGDTVTRCGHRSRARVAGPYYACAGAIVRVSNDISVVLGNPDGPLAPPTTDAQLLALATLAYETLEEVSPSKRLGDELEVLHAVRSIVTAAKHSLDDTLDQIVRVAVDALSCERAKICVQDTSRSLTSDRWSPFGFADGVRSVLAVRIPPPLGGLLVLAHTSAAPRGFTQLCQRVGEQLADTACVIAHTAALRDELHVAALEQAQVARTDALTGLGNRLRWDEALVAAQQAVDGGASVTIVTLDVDGLKAVNDSVGHDAGDELLRRCAAILSEHCRSDDVVVRLGGDEFAMLLPLAADLAEQRISTLVASLSPTASGPCAVAASIGRSTAAPGDSVADAMRDADANMYLQKRARRNRQAVFERRAV